VSADVPSSTFAKVVPLAALFFCASFNLTILANLKVRQDRLVSRRLAPAAAADVWPGMT